MSKGRIALLVLALLVLFFMIRSDPAGTGNQFGNLIDVFIEALKSIGTFFGSFLRSAAN